jgi:histidinol-phosphate aminotransferase
VRLERRWEPLARIGVYAPGGTAAYPSSVLMGVVPAKVAGVSEVVVCSPPGRDGLPPAVVLAACAIAGADRVFGLGGAGAVAAMAFGTASVPRVAKVVGPGNAWVDAAKRLVAGLGVVAVDAPAGPSDVLVVADATADPELVAAELLAQAEHDRDAAAVLVATDAALLAAVRAELLARLAEEPRGEVIADSLAANGALLLAESLPEALAFAARYAPEHLALMVADPRATLAGVRCAGSVTLGAASSVVFGDYASGANHVLPTSGRAAVSSGLSTAEFLRTFTVQELTAPGAAALAPVVRALAEAEGLPAHARAAALRAQVADRRDAAGVERAVASGTERAIDLAGEAASESSAMPARESRLEVAPAALADPASEPGQRGPRPREGVAGVLPYDPGRRPVEVDLSDNTNRWGVAPGAVAVLVKTGAERVTRYPTPYAEELRDALAAAAGVGREHVVTGCGSDDVLDALLRAFAGPGDVVAYAPPTFGIVPDFARVAGASPRAVPLTADLALDEDELVAADPAVTYLCRPNNPTGTLFPRAAVERLASHLRGLLVVDEAYIDFAGPGESLAAWAAASRNVAVLRTLSKAHGLAGLRLGYAVGPAEVVRAATVARGPYKVGGVAEAAALAVLARDCAWVAERAGWAVAARERLTASLRERGLAVLPSAANFVFVTPPASCGGAAAAAAALRELGVGVRAFTGLPVVGDGLRVTVGPEDQMARFLAALDQVLASDREVAVAAAGGRL